MPDFFINSLTKAKFPLTDMDVYSANHLKYFDNLWQEDNINILKVIYSQGHYRDITFKPQGIFG